MLKKLIIFLGFLLVLFSPISFVQADEGYSDLFISVGDAMMKTKSDDWNSVEKLIVQLNEDWQLVEETDSPEAKGVTESLKKLDQVLVKRDKQPMLDALTEISHALVALEKQQNPVDEQAEREKFKNAFQPTLVELKEAIDSEDAEIANEKYKNTLSAWTKNELIVREQSIAFYGKIETQMGFLRIALSQDEKDFDKMRTISNTLAEVVEAFLSGEELQIKDEGYTLQTLVDLLEQADVKIEASNPNDAIQILQEFITVWPSVEGEVRTRNGRLYTKLESEIPVIAGKLSSKDKNVEELQTQLKSLRQSIELLQEKTSYSIWDAALIMLREGLEALLIITVLIAFLRKANAPEKQKWIWLGAFVGLLMSIIAAVIITMTFSAATAGANRELIEGVTGIIAVVMMIGVGMWLHQKSNMTAWNHYVKKHMGTAISTGSIASMAFISFLSIFREGAETIIFYLGMAPSMTTGDLLSGIAIALVILIVFAFFFIRFSTKIPVGAIFKIATVLIYLLAFKILGVSIHALQLTGHLTTSQIYSLPIISNIGFYPTWETIIPQLILIAIIILVAFKLKRAERNNA